MNRLTIGVESMVSYCSLSVASCVAFPWVYTVYLPSCAWNCTARLRLDS